MDVITKLTRRINLWRSVGDKIKARRRLKAQPLNIHLEINDQCNLKCFMCPRHCEDIPKDVGWFDPELIERISGAFRFAHYIGLAGNGEPFLHPRLYDILKTISRYGSVPCIITNGALLTEEWIRKLINLGPSILTTSFDGGTRETFETIRVGARFDGIMDSLRLLKRLKEEKGTPFPVLNFLVCVMRENQNELTTIMERAHELNATKVIFQSIFPFTERAKRSMIPDLGEIEELVKPAMEYGVKKKIEVSFAPLSFGVHKRLERKNERLEPGAPLFCENIWQTLHVRLNGDARFCCFWLGEPVGNLKDASIAELWNHPQFQELRGRLSRGEIPENCLNCHILEPHNPKDIRERCSRASASLF